MKHMILFSHFCLISNGLIIIFHTVCVTIWYQLFRVLIGPYLNFGSLTSPTCCNSPRKCTPVKWKVRQKAGYQFRYIDNLFITKYKAILLINIEFRVSKLQTHFSQGLLFIGCNIFSQVIVICLSSYLYLKYIS